MPLLSLRFTHCKGCLSEQPSWRSQNKLGSFQQLREGLPFSGAKVACLALLHRWTSASHMQSLTTVVQYCPNAQNVHSR